MEKKRVVSKKVRIFDLVNGVFFHGNKLEMKPSYVITQFGEKISRVNLVGTLVDLFISEDESYGSITIEDGTSSIRVKVFGNNVKLIKNISKGDLLVVIGKLKEYNGEIYVVAEILRKLEDPNYENLRKLEILKELRDKKKMVEEIRSLVEQMSEDELKKYIKKKYGLDEEGLSVIRENLKFVKDIDYKPKILEIICKMDRGDGVEIGKLFEVIHLPERVIENAINDLLSSGDLFEPRPGFLKKVKI
ncbi:MAG: OB-fold nucleic acid binding domain-containing protein [Candidatus Aenigmatarchaeota archaeon]